MERSLARMSTERNTPCKGFEKFRTPALGPECPRLHRIPLESGVKKKESDKSQLELEISDPHASVIAVYSRDPER